jgi:hypothetical protein
MLTVQQCLCPDLLQIAMEFRFDENDSVKKLLDYSILVGYVRIRN